MTQTISTQTRIHADRKISRIVRAACRASGTPYPISVVEGFAAPKLTGRSYYWTTPSGLTEVRYPGAYKWPTWYHASTRKIVVGAGWILERLMEAEAAAEAAKAERRKVDRLLRRVGSESISPRGGVRFDAEGGYRVEEN